MLARTLSRLGRGAARRPRRVVALWLLVAALAVVAASALGGRTTDTMTVPGLDSQLAADLLRTAGSDRAGLTAQVVAAPVDPAATFPGTADVRRALDRLEDRVDALPHVVGTDRAVSGDGRVAVLRVQYPEQAQLSADDLHALVAVVGAGPPGSPLRVEAGGDLFVAFADPGTGAAEAVGLLVAAVVLLFAFGSLVAAAMPVGTAVIGLAVGTSLISLAAAVTEVPSMATTLGAMVGLGVGVDYALFVLTRHREYLARGLGVVDAAGRAVATAGQPVVLAGGAVVVSILGLAVAGVPFMTVGAVGVSLVVLIMVVASLTLLPAFLGLAGTRVARPGRGPGGGWSRWVGHVTRHPRAYALGCTALLLAASAPVLGLRVGLPDDGALPPDRTERRAYDLVTQGFGAGANGALVLAVDPAGDPAVLPRIAAAVAADPGVASVAPPRVDGRTGVASLLVVPTTGPQEEATTATVDRLRSRVLPAAVGDGPARAHVGGAAAVFADIGRRVADRLPLFVGAVLLMSFLLLMLFFRSVVLPLKAVLVNVLGIGTAYGVLVLVFQEGWGAGLIGLEETVPVVSFIPMFMFAILFGLSMDYEVFLLSRVREEYLRGGDAAAAVVRGVSATARVITSAALVMVSVFLAFVLAPDASTKMFGLGLATAILVDATLVRLVLVPAAMTVLGRANWWLPGWLDRLLAHVATPGGEPPIGPPVEPPIGQDAVSGARREGPARPVARTSG